MMTKKQQARWDALPQEEKDKIDARAMQGAQEYKNAQEESKAVELRKAYNDDPELWRSHNLTKVDALMLIKAAMPNSPTSEATFMANYQGRVRELSRATDTALERALVEQVALCQLRLQCTDFIYTEHDHGTIEVLDFWDRRLSAAQRRFDKACLDLARVRRLALPVLQLNIADKQQVIVAQINSKG